MSERKQHSTSAERSSLESSRSQSKSLLSSELASSRKQYHELLKAYQELEQRQSFEVEELKELNASLMAQVDELQNERNVSLQSMQTIIMKNEELEREIQIMFKALELKDQDEDRQKSELQNQLLEERRRLEELHFIREQDNSELVRIENELVQLSISNKELAKQVEIAAQLADEKSKRVKELEAEIHMIQDETRDQESSLIKHLTDDIKQLTRENSSLHYKVKEQHTLIEDFTHDFQSIRESLEQTKSQLIQRERQVNDLEGYVIKLTQDIAQMTKLLDSTASNQKVQQQQLREKENTQLFSNKEPEKINRVIEEEREKNRRLLSEMKSIRLQYSSQK